MFHRGLQQLSRQSTLRHGFPNEHKAVTVCILWAGTNHTAVFQLSQTGGQLHKPGPKQCNYIQLQTSRHGTVNLDGTGLTLLA